MRFLVATAFAAAGGWREIADHLKANPGRSRAPMGTSRAMAARRKDGAALALRLTAARVGKAIVVLCRGADTEPGDFRSPANRERLAAILAASPDAAIVIDESGTVTLFSAAAERMFGHAAADVDGANVSVLMPQPYREQHDAYLAHYHKTGEKRIIGIGRVVVGLRKDGGTFPMELNVGEFWTSGRRWYIGFVHDITSCQGLEKRMNELQAELLHVSRLSAMGQLAGALAHELNQPLTALSNYLKAAERTVAAVDDAAVARARELMDKAAGQAMRAGGIIARLRAFIGKDRDKRAAEDANRIVQEALALALVGAAEDNVQLRVELAPHLPKVWVDRIPIQQVVINLVRNAVEAMQAVNDRRLTITTGIDSADVRISVADSGPGLAPDIAERLFQPFRGTKSSGMGLGLSICKTIIDAHGGRLWTEPNSGAGTVFRFTVPVAAD